MLIFYSLALLLVLAVASPWWLFRMATSGKYRDGLAERLGFIPARLRHSLGGDPSRPQVLWIHAVSVGEILAAARLIDELTRRLASLPQSGGAGKRPLQVVISTTTRTGQRLARQRFGDHRVFYFPLDFAFAVRRWLRFLRPCLLVLVETEFWPRMIVECRRAGVPIAVVNARISDRSWPRYRRLAPLWSRLLRDFAVVLAQTGLDAQRLRALGAANVQVGGNLKYDVRSVQPAPIVTLLRSHIPSGTPVLVCGSTLPGEEDLLLQAIPPGIVTILAPRHPERFAEVSQLLRRRNQPWLLRSEWAASPSVIATGTIVLLDSIGELASVYSLATAAFIGGSLVPSGGHNPLEPAQFAVPVVMGPSYQNFRGIVDQLRQHHAIRIVPPESLAAVLAELLSGGAESRPPEWREMGERARTVFASEAGATARAVETILALLHRQSEEPS